jgi:hypothetical protein
VVQAQEAPASSDLQLPGDVEAIQVATISAQTPATYASFTRTLATACVPDNCWLKSIPHRLTSSYNKRALI